MKKVFLFILLGLIAVLIIWGLLIVLDLTGQLEKVIPFKKEPPPFRDIVVEDLPFEAIKKGRRGENFRAGQTKTEKRVFKDKESWEKFWLEAKERVKINGPISSEGIPDPDPDPSGRPRTPTLPLIDFTEEMIAAIFLGPSGGLDELTIHEIDKLGGAENKVVVDAIKSIPPPDVPVSEVITYPYHIVKFKKVDLPIEFVITTQTRR